MVSSVELTGQFLLILGERAGWARKPANPFTELAREREEIHNRHDPRQFVAADGGHTSRSQATAFGADRLAPELAWRNARREVGREAQRALGEDAFRG